MEMNHVLIVEDDKEIREGVEIYLKSQGYVVFQAADGVEGLEVIEKERYGERVISSSYIREALKEGICLWQRLFLDTRTV